MGAALKTFFIIPFIVSVAALVASCSADLNLSEFSFACQNDSDCAAGQRCDRTAGCVPIPGGDTCTAGAEDCGGAAGRDAGRTDGGVRPDAGDAGITTDGSAGDGGDGGHDAGGEDAGDAGDTGTTDGGDAGVDDGGVSRDAGLVLRFSSVNDTAAGVCTSTGYFLKSVTGWTAGFRWAAGGYILEPGEPFAK